MVKRTGDETLTVRYSARCNHWQVSRAHKGRAYCAKIYKTRRQAALAYIAWR